MQRTVAGLRETRTPRQLCAAAGRRMVQERPKAPANHTQCHSLCLAARAMLLPCDLWQQRRVLGLQPSRRQAQQHRRGSLAPQHGAARPQHNRAQTNTPTHTAACAATPTRSVMR